MILSTYSMFSHLNDFSKKTDLTTKSEEHKNKILKIHGHAPPHHPVEMMPVHDDARYNEL